MNLLGEPGRKGQCGEQMRGAEDQLDGVGCGSRNQLMVGRAGEKEIPLPPYAHTFPAPNSAQSELTTGLWEFKKCWVGSPEIEL